MLDMHRRAILGLAFAALLSQGTVFGQAGQAQAGAEAAQNVTVRRLSVEEAVRLALEQNLALQVQRLEPELQDLNILQTRTAWTPTLTSTLTTTRSLTPTSSYFSGADQKLTDNLFSADVVGAQLLPWGANYKIEWTSSRERTNSIYNSPNPALAAALKATYVQPLLRNWKIDSTRQAVLIGKKNREMTDVQLRQAVLVTLRNVKDAYWDLVFAVENLKVQQESLDVARAALKNNQSRVRIGTMAPIDIIEAEAEVARNEESVIVAEASITKAEDALRQLIFDPKAPGFWTTKLELSDQPVFQPQVTDVDAAVTAALARRTDLVNARKGLEATDINIRYYKNQLLPTMNLTASYGLTGQGGTSEVYTDTFPVMVLGESSRSYGSTLSQMLGNDYHNWAVALTLGYPLGKSSAEAGLARAKVAYHQSELALRNQELSVATQVRDVVRTMNTNRKRVDATRASRTLAEKKLEAEQKKFEAGMSNNFQVIQAQRDLATARNAELQAVLDYLKSYVDYETIQEAPLNGGSIALAAATQ